MCYHTFKIWKIKREKKKSSSARSRAWAEQSPWEAQEWGFQRILSCDLRQSILIFDPQFLLWRERLGRVNSGWSLWCKGCWDGELRWRRCCPSPRRGSHAQRGSAGTRGISQARTGVGCHPPGDLPNPGIEPTSLALAGGFSTTSPEAQYWVVYVEKRFLS